MNEQLARLEICRVGKSLFERGYAHATAGNISVHLQDSFLITPTDACLGFLAPYEIESGRSKIFNLCEDPKEHHDVAVQYRERVDVYRAHLERWGTAQTALMTAGRRR